MLILVLVIHLILAVALIGVVLIQKSEGGGLGLGGGGGGGGMSGFMTGRSAANLLTRTTAILAGLFMVTSLVLAIFAGRTSSGGRSILDEIPTSPATSTAPAGAGTTPAPPATTGDTAPKPAEPKAPSVPLAK